MSKPTTVDEHLANVPGTQAKSLQDLREKIVKNIPSVEEKIVFGKPFYYLGGKYVVSFAAAKAHNSLHTMSFDVAKHLTPNPSDNWAVDGGSVKFAIDQLLDEAIVQDVIARRRDEMGI